MRDSRDSAHFNTRHEVTGTAAGGQDRFCPRRVFFDDIGEPLERARLIARSTQKVRKIGGRAGKGMSRFDSRNARYTSDDINERQGERNFSCHRKRESEADAPSRESRRLVAFGTRRRIDVQRVRAGDLAIETTAGCRRSFLAGSSRTFRNRHDDSHLCATRIISD